MCHFTTTLLDVYSCMCMPQAYVCDMLFLSLYVVYMVHLPSLLLPTIHLLNPSLPPSLHYIYISSLPPPTIHLLPPSTHYTSPPSLHPLYISLPLSTHCTPPPSLPPFTHYTSPPSLPPFTHYTSPHSLLPPSTHYTSPQPLPPSLHYSAQVRHSSSALLHYMGRMSGNVETLEPLANTLLQILRDYQQDTRVILPLLKTLDLLLSNGVFDVYTNLEK